MIIFVGLQSRCSSQNFCILCSPARSPVFTVPLRHIVFTSTPLSSLFTMLTLSSRYTSLRLTSTVATVPIPLLVPSCTRIHRRYSTPAVLIPGDSVVETTTIGGTVTFFSIYQNVIGESFLFKTVPLPRFRAV